jgi:hypothetical protein
MIVRHSGARADIVIKENRYGIPAPQEFVGHDDAAGWLLHDRGSRRVILRRARRRRAEESEENETDETPVKLTAKAHRKS